VRELPLPVDAGDVVVVDPYMSTLSCSPVSASALPIAGTPLLISWIVVVAWADRRR